MKNKRNHVSISVIMRYFVGFLVTIGLLILLIVLLVTGGGGGNKQSPQPGNRPRSISQLASYADTDASAQMVIDGKINADQNHTAIRITVNNNDVTYEQIQGYQGTVVNRQVFKNNTNAFNNFLYALGHAGFLRGDSNPKSSNEKGVCPLGHRFIFTLTEGGQNLLRYWSTNCKGLTGTYKGSLNLTQQLFQLQVPQYSELTSTITSDNF